MDPNLNKRDPADYKINLWEECKNSREGLYSTESALYRFMARMHLSEKTDYLFENPEELGNIFKKYDAGAYAYQMERGEETGKLHFQIFLKLKEKIRAKQLARELQHNNLHGIEVRSAAANDNVCMKYCTKEETRVAGPWIYPLDLPWRRQSYDST